MKDRVVPWKDPRMWTAFGGLIITWVGYWWPPIKEMIGPEMLNTAIISIISWFAMRENREPSLT